MAPAGLHAEIAERILRNGPIRWDDYMEAALYHPEHGFFTTGAGAGRGGGDFLTSPEVGPLFGAVMARALDRWWDDLGRPDPFVVVEAGAGRGALAVSVLHAGPDCSAALRYVLVERSDQLRARQREHLDLEEPSNALGPVSENERGDAPDEVRGRGPVVVSVPDLPAIQAAGALIANELLDNLPVRLLERQEGEWREVRVGLGEGQSLVEVLVSAHPTLAGEADRLAPDAPDGARVPLQREALAWLREARGVVKPGRVVVLDYAATTAEMAARPWTDWLRTYRGHRRGGHPLDEPGSQDLTVDVAVDQLAVVDRPRHDRTQVEFLAAHGMDDLVAEGRRRWEEGKAAPDLDAVEGRSRVSEAEALSAVPGLGAHRVLEWVIR